MVRMSSHHARSAPSFHYVGSFLPNAGPIEDYEDELGNLLVADYDEGQDWEAADNLAKIENREILRVLENPAVANP